MTQNNEIRMGIIGAGGFIGQGHLRRIAYSVEGAVPTMIYDLNTERVNQLCAQYGIKAAASAEELIASPDVDAVLIAAWDGVHAELTRKCIEAGKPVFCEKPLATTLEDCADVVAAEKASGKKLVQVGFMRRYDADFRKMKEILDSGELGHPIMAHCISRTPKIAAGFTDPMQVTNIVIHEIDQFRWLLGEPIARGQMIYGRPTCFAEEGLHDPQLALMWSESGVLIDVECAANSYYGYEIECEIVCEKGTIRLPDPPAPIVRTRLSCSSEILADWSVRFPDAYRAELQAFVDRLRGKNKETYPDSNDGYAACAVANAMILSQTTGKAEKVLYD